MLMTSTEDKQGDTPWIWLIGQHIISLLNPLTNLVVRAVDRVQIQETRRSTKPTASR